MAGGDARGGARAQVQPLRVGLEPGSTEAAELGSGIFRYVKAFAPLPAGE